MPPGGPAVLGAVLLIGIRPSQTFLGYLLLPQYLSYLVVPYSLPRDGILLVALRKPDKII